MLCKLLLNHQLLFINHIICYYRILDVWDRNLVICFNGNRAINVIDVQSNLKNLQIPWKFLCDRTAIRSIFAAIDQRRNCWRKSAFKLTFQLSSIDLFRQLLILFHLFLPRDSRSLLSLLSISQLLFDAFAKHLSFPTIKSEAEIKRASFSLGKGILFFRFFFF